MTLFCTDCGCTCKDVVLSMEETLKLRNLITKALSVNGYLVANRVSVNHAGEYENTSYMDRKADDLRFELEDIRKEIDEILKGPL